MSEYECFAFRPWMGYVAGAILVAIGLSSNSDLALLPRALGLFLFFGTSFWSEHTYRLRTGAGGSVRELRSFVFAVFAGLATLLGLVQLVLDVWKAAG